MKFRTEVEIRNSEIKIEKSDKIFSIGSCFATEIHQILSNGQIQSLNNPFGTIFNPYSIRNEFEFLKSKKKFDEKDIISYKDKFISLDHHSSFDGQNLEAVLSKINNNIVDANLFLKESKWVIITFGTSYIYEFLPKQKLVANCHKIPGKFFNKRLLTSNEIQQSILETIQIINEFCPSDIQILFTVSPVRHSKDGWTENNISKSLLISNLYEVIKYEQNCHYLPVYEIMMDELRDYRFYKEDMLHPNQQAVNFIFDKFKNAYFFDDCIDFVQENFKILKSQEHQSHDKNSIVHQEFLAHIEQKIRSQQQKVTHPIFQSVKQNS